MTGRVREYGLEGRVHFLGVREDIGRLLSAADLMIFPSLREGLPGSVVEASAAGLAVIASDIPGIRELAGVAPGLRLCSLHQTDKEWATECLGTLGAESGLEQRRREFPSVLDSANSREQFQNLYSAVAGTWR